ncbi:MORN repeat protein [compost metagenome]
MTKRWRLILTLLIGALMTLNLATANTGTAAAAAKKVTVKYSSGAVYYGEVKNGKPSGFGTMTWSKNKVYEGSWVNGQRSGYGKLTTVSRDGETVKKEEYIGNWSMDKKDGEGKMVMKSTTNSRPAENSVQQGKYKRDLLVSGFTVRHVFVADPPYSFEYKDSKLLLRILGDKDYIDAIKDGYFFSFEYQKGKVHRKVGVGDDYDTAEFSKFIQNISKEIKPYLSMFKKLAAGV